MATDPPPYEHPPPWIPLQMVSQADVSCTDSDIRMIGYYPLKLLINAFRFRRHNHFLYFVMCIDTVGLQKVTVVSSEIYNNSDRFNQQFEMVVSSITLQ